MDDNKAFQVSLTSRQRQSAVLNWNKNPPNRKPVNDGGDGSAEGGVLDGVWVFFSCINKCWRGTPVAYGAPCVHISKQTNGGQMKF